MNSIWRPKGNGARRRRDREKSVSQEFRPLGGNYCLIAYECDAISWVSSWKKRKTDRETEKGGEETQSFGNRRRRYNEGARIGSAARLPLFPLLPRQNRQVQRDSRRTGDFLVWGACDVSFQTISQACAGHVGNASEYVSTRLRWFTLRCS